MSNGLRPDRLELLTPRARIVVAEPAALAALELALLERPERLTASHAAPRKGLAERCLYERFAPDLLAPAERAFVAREIERLMRALQAEMGFDEGISGPEYG